MFKVGDIIIAKEFTPSWYNVTNKENGFVGVVRRVYGERVLTETLESVRKQHIGTKFEVKQKYFELKFDLKKEGEFI